MDSITSSSSSSWDFEPRPNSSKPLSLYLVLRGFFTFYTRYSFKERIICPWIGESQPRDGGVTLHYHGKKPKGGLCVQDMLELDRDIGGNIEPEFVPFFVNKLRTVNRKSTALFRDFDRNEEKAGSRLVALLAETVSH
jgi:hypothetical protein